MIAPLGQADAREDEREFADLKQRQADGQRHDATIAERTNDSGEDGGFADDDRR